MKKLRSIATFADLLVLALVVILNPLSPLQPSSRKTTPHIPNKVEIRYHKTIAPDSLQQARIEAEMDEMRYYLKVHNVSD